MAMREVPLCTPIHSFVSEELELLPVGSTLVRRPAPGVSRTGLPVPSIHLGDGPIQVSLTAGAHADEPAGPLAALQFCHEILADPDLLHGATWHIFPHVNPDGAMKNAEWFRPVPDLALYIQHRVRDLPGDDVEFNYPGAQYGTTHPPRPENIHVANILRPYAPFDLHISLHGMAFAQGTWWLIGREWEATTAPLRDSLGKIFAANGLGLHDIDRRGEKGFHRIEKGFSTTPTSLAMREYFLQRDEVETADLFHYSSMEFVQSLGGNPLVMVSELPLFVVSKEGQDAIRGLLSGDKAGNSKAHVRNAEYIAREYAPRPVPFSTQVKILCAAIRESFLFIRSLR